MLQTQQGKYIPARRTRTRGGGRSGGSHIGRRGHLRDTLTLALAELRLIVKESLLKAVLLLAGLIRNPMDLVIGVSANKD